MNAEPICTTDGLIAYYKEHSELPHEALEEGIGEAIDTLYTARDAGLPMHDACAAAAVAALDAGYGVIYMAGARSARELVALILDVMPGATNRDLAADGSVGNEEELVWAKIEAKAREIRSAALTGGDST